MHLRDLRSLHRAPSASPMTLPMARNVYKTKTCVACHGSRAARPIQTYPAIAGQNEKYLLTQLHDIKCRQAHWRPRIQRRDIPTSGHGRQSCIWSTTTISRTFRPISPRRRRANRSRLIRPRRLTSWRPVPKAYKTLGCVACHGEDGKKPMRQDLSGDRWSEPRLPDPPDDRHARQVCASTANRS